MSAPSLEFAPGDPEALARRFFESLKEGHLVDALETLSPTAVISDDTGPDRRGLREITASLIPFRTPSLLRADRFETLGDAVSARVQIPGDLTKGPRRYRARLTVRGGRIQTVTLRPL